MLVHVRARNRLKQKLGFLRVKNSRGTSDLIAKTFDQRIEIINRKWEDQSSYLLFDVFISFSLILEAIETSMIRTERPTEMI